MKNIFKVFLSDARRLSSNVVAIVIIMGLGIIPALYAWFNVLSNWDPYGETATSEMHIAVFSEDTGFEYGDVKLNIGDTVVDGLRENKTIGWVFTESREEALGGVYNGEYYAAFVIPTDFTENLLSFISKDVENPTILYFENSKKNAIATKITSKVKTTVQNQVNTSIVSKLTEVASKSGEVVTGEKSEVNIINTTKDKLHEMDKSLGTYASILNTLSLLTDSTNDLVGSTQALIPSAENLIAGSQGTVSSLQGTVLAGAETADTIAKMVDISMDSITSSLENLENQLILLDTVSGYGSITNSLNTINTLLKSTVETLEGIDGVSELSEYQELVRCMQELSIDVETFTSDEAVTEQKIKELKTTISEETKKCKKSIKKLKETFDYKIAPSLSQSVYTVESALIDTQTMLSNLDDSFPGIDRALQSYKNTLAQGTDSIVASRDYVVDIQNKLHTLIEGLDTLSGDAQYQEIASILKADPELIAQFVASPIMMETKKIYEIETYGSAMAPFYTVLALWVGALILVALVHVKVKDEPELEGVKQWQKFFGRYITFFIIGQAQTLLTVLGDLFYIRIQCPHPFLFWVAGAVSSLVFTMFMYALTVAFGNVGQAIAVVVMVVQVAGAGGTFPVEVLPQVYQAVYRFLPFTYCMNAMRECVGGLYHLDFLKDIGILGIYFVISLFIGLVLRKPFVKLNEMIDRSKEKSGIML